MSGMQMIDRAKSWTFRQDSQTDDGVIITRVLACNQEPRISVVSRYERGLEKVLQVWRVDGVEHISFNAALARLMLDEADPQRGKECF